MRARGCIVAFLLLASIIAPPNAVAGPPPSGDWIVTGSEAYGNTTLIVNGSVYVMAGATLVLDNVTLLVNVTFSGDQIRVDAGATLILKNAVVKAYDPARRYYFRVFGSLRATNATVRDLMGDGGYPYYGGLQILGGSIWARVLNLVNLTTNGLHAEGAIVDVDRIWVGPRPEFGVYLNHTIGAKISNLTVVTDDAVGGAGGVFAVDSPWMNLTDVASSRNFGDEVYVARSDHGTIRRASLAQRGNAGYALVRVGRSVDLKFLDSHLSNTTTCGFDAFRSSVAVGNVTFVDTEGMVIQDNSTADLSGLSFLVSEPIPPSAMIQVLSGSSAQGRNISRVDPAWLHLWVADNSSTRLEDSALKGDVLASRSVVELVNVSNPSPEMFSVWKGSTATFTNYTAFADVEGYWSAAFFDTAARYVVDRKWLRAKAIDADGTPIPGADVLVADDGVPFYRSPGFGGTDPPMGADGQTAEFAAPFRAFHPGSADGTLPFTNVTYNRTAIQISKVGYRFRPAQSVLLNEGFESGSRSDWRMFVFNRFGAIPGWGSAVVVPGELDGTGAYVVKLQAQRDYETVLLYTRPESIFWRDYAAEASARLEAGEPTSSVCLFFYLQSNADFNDGYQVRLSVADDTVRLYRLDRTVPTEIGNALYPVDFGFTYRVRVEPAGGWLRVLVNGTPVIEAEDATYRSGTMALGAATGGPGMLGPFVRALFDNVHLVGHDGRSFVADATPPTIASAEMVPDPVDVGGTGTIRVVVFDDGAVDGVWANVSGPGGSSNLTMAESQSSLWEASYVPATPRRYDFTVWARDSAGWWASRAGAFDVADLSPPLFSDASVTPPVSTPGDSFTFDATVRDNVGVVAVSANVTGPEVLNVTLAPAGGGAWTATQPFTRLGVYGVTFWASDAAGHWASAGRSFTVGDFAPPHTTFTILGANATVGPVRYLASASTVALVATDDFSGVARTEDRVDGGPWTTYAAPFPLSPGPHLLEFRSVDLWGNVEDIGSALLHVDATAPDLALRVSGPAVGTILGPTATLDLTAMDGESGVASVECRMDGGSWLPYAGGIPAGPEGPHTLEYRAADRVGNEASFAYGYIVDGTGPSTSVAVGSPNVTTMGLFVSPATPFALSASDPAGIKSIEYRVDGAPWTPYAAPFCLIGEGPHVIDYRATDLLGNPSVVGSLPATVDARPPDLQLLVGVPNATLAGTEYVGAETPLDIAASDAGAGIASVEYVVAGVTHAYAGPFTLSGCSGAVVVESRATDRLGQSSVSTRTFFVDVSAPIAKVDALSGLALLTNETAVFSAARSSDDSGLVAYAWEFGDGSGGTGIVASHVFLAPGDYDVNLTVTDVIGRTSTVGVRVNVTTPIPPPPPVVGVPWGHVAGLAVLSAAVVALSVLLWRERRRARREEPQPLEEAESQGSSETPVRDK